MPELQQLAAVSGAAVVAVYLAVGGHLVDTWLTRRRPYERPEGWLLMAVTWPVWMKRAALTHGSSSGGVRGHRRPVNGAGGGELW